MTGFRNLVVDRPKRAHVTDDEVLVLMRAVVKLNTEKTPATRSQLMAVTGLARKVFLRHMARPVDDGLVEPAPQGAWTGYTLTPAGVAFLAAHTPAVESECPAS